LGVPYTDSDTGEKHYFASVSGRASGMNELVACLVLDEVASHTPGSPLPPSKVYSGKVLRSGMHWIIGFRKLPPGPKNYWLFVAQSGPPLPHGGPHKPSVPHRSLAMQITVSGPQTVVSEEVKDLAILFPPSDETICPTFTSYGPDSDPPANSAKMKLGTTDVQSGLQVLGPPPGVWMFQFANVPDNIGYKFVVTNGMGATKQSTNITVDSEACVPPLAPDPPGGGGPPPPPP